MQQITTKIRKWGNSCGVIIPKEVLKKEHLRAGKTVTLTLNTNEVTRVKDIFGLLKGKLKKDTQTLMDELNKDLDQEF